MTHTDLNEPRATNAPNTHETAGTKRSNGAVSVAMAAALATAGFAALATAPAALASGTSAGVSVEAEADVKAEAESDQTIKIFTGGGGFLGLGGGGDVAIKGYDPVAYFKQGAAVEGSESHTFVWQDTTWQFSSAANRDAFAANPDKFAPAYGGFCAYAVAKGDLVKIDPEAWSIVDGQLYLNYSQRVQTKWNKDRASFISKANTQWPSIGHR